MYAGVDTVLLGRRTYEMTQQPGAPPWPAKWRVFVFSKTLRPEEHRNVTVITTGAPAVVRALRGESGKDIWLFGGGSLFRSLLDAELVDTVEIAVIPVLLGGGVPLVEPGAARTRLKLAAQKGYPTGIVVLRYEVDASA